MATAPTTMPYHWTETTTDQTSHLHLWPYRSLPRRGFVWFIGATASFLALPLVAVLGSPVLWVLLPFLLAALAAIWVALQKNDRDRRIVEELALTRETITLTRTGPRGIRHDWRANPHWVSVTIYPTTGPVPDYLTLRGEGREVELGTFLTPEERMALRDELQARLLSVRRAI
jgi:uncharacterized membrane protein